MKITGSTITWDAEDWLGGFVLDNQESADSLSFGQEVGKGLVDMDSFYPFLPLGIAKPGLVGTNATNNSSARPSEIQVDITDDSTGGFYYSIGGDDPTAQMLQIDAGSGAITNNGQWPETLTRTGCDTSLGSVVLYHVNGAQMLFYSYNISSTNWDVGTVTPGATSTQDNDFMSTVPTNPLAAPYLVAGGNKYHHLYVAQDDKLYIGGGRYVHQYVDDGTAAGLFNANVLTLPQNYQVIGFAENQYDLVVFATTGTDFVSPGICRAFFWSQERPTSWYKEVIIPDGFVAAPFTYKGIPGCFSGVSADPVSLILRLWDGVEFKPVFRQRLISAVPPVFGSVTTWNDMVLWNNSGRVYAYGSYRDTTDPHTWFIGRGVGTGNGIIKSIGAVGTIIASTGNGTNGGLQTLARYSTGNATGLTAYPTFGGEMRGKIEFVEATFSRLSQATARSLTLSLYNEQRSLSAISTVSSTTNGVIKRWYPENFTVSNSLQQFDSLTPVLTWNTGAGSDDAVGLQKLVVHYEPVTYTSSDS